MDIDQTKKKQTIDAADAAWKKWTEESKPTHRDTLERIYDEAWEEGYRAAEAQAAMDAAGADL